MKSSKYIFCISSFLLFLVSPLIFAEVVPYVGANISYNGSRFQIKDALSTQTELNANGLRGGLFAGYGSLINKLFYWGLESFVSEGSLESQKKSNNYGGESQFSSGYSLGLSFIPGFKVTDNTMIYGRVGAVATRFNTTQSSVTQIQSKPETIFQLLRAYSSQTVAGSQLGLGVQTSIVNHLDFRSEFIHTDYHSFTVFRDIPLSGSVKPRSNQINLGFVYKFD